VCQDCGCNLPGEVAIDGVPVSSHTAPSEGAVTHGHDLEHPHTHAHDHAHDHDHPHSHAEHRTLPVEQAILAKNDRLAERNRGFWAAKRLGVLNLLASPGSGKTALIERTASDPGKALRLGVIVGDLATENDALRLRACGVPAIQITTGSVCHLDAEMVARAMAHLDLDALDLLLIENVGNLVCPAVYDLGETARVVLLSVTEGEDKPLKYPVIFQRAQLILVTKTDLAAAAGFNREAALRNLGRIAPTATILEVSAKTGQGMEAWNAYLRQAMPR
jgi:hydrogenase nickel incorporation protein HypB